MKINDSRNNNTIIILTVLFVIFNDSKIYAQQYKPLNTFTTNQGLPSNHIYDITQDDKGFLWIATDNGVSRFDGKYFENYDVKNGLPGNDVIQLKRTTDGTIWVNCYRQVPAYFDEKSNSFVSFSNNESVKEKLGAILFMENWDTDTIVYHNKFGKLYFSKKKLVATYTTKNNIFQMSPNMNGLTYTYSDSSTNSIQTFYYNNKKVAAIKYQKLMQKTQLHHNKFFVRCINSNDLFVISNMNYPFKNIKIDTIQLKENILNINFSKNQIHLIYKDNKIENLDFATLQEINKLENIPTANCIYIDNNNNAWIGTTENGLHYYAISDIDIVDLPKTIIEKNYESICVANNNQIYAGNNFGEIINIKKNIITQYHIPQDNSPVRIKKIISTHNKIISLTDKFYSYNFKNNYPIIIDKKNVGTGLKKMELINDSSLLIGAIAGVFIVNINTNKNKALHIDNDRIFDIAKIDNTNFYYINSYGLFSHNISFDTSVAIPLQINIKEETPNLLLYSIQKTLWIITSKGNIIIVKNNKQIYKINKEKGFPENITKIIAIDNKIWMASKTGICVLTHNNNFNQFQYSISNITKEDGLPSNAINDITSLNDTIYVATENGIAYFPKNISFATTEIIPQLTSITINQKQLLLQDKYNLQANENNVMLTFTGIDITGHFKNFEYAVDDSTNWINSKGNTINIQLNSGEHIMYVRCIDINNKISKKILVLQFTIATPFYKTIWFGILLSVLATAMLLLFYNRKKLSQQKISYEKQLALEQQRNKITADLHDDIGATLSSLQVNSAVAHQLIAQNPKSAEKVIEKIEAQSKELAEKIGDIIWSMKPGKDEFMNISSRIKNFANDMLGATNIEYAIDIPKEINTLVLDITIRKNIVFITKEAINNAVKYSNASKLLITIAKINNTLALQIEDNGNGFETIAKEGNGIGNMKNRAKEVNGIFTITSNNKGTKVRIEIPIQQ